MTEPLLTSGPEGYLRYLISLPHPAPHQRWAKPVPGKASLRDLVEEGAARRGEPPRTVWRLALDAIAQNILPVCLLEDATLDTPFVYAYAQTLTLRGVVIDALYAVERRYFNPGQSPWATKLMLNRTHFVKWLDKAIKVPRGPRRGTSGYYAADRKLFPTIKRMLKSGEARSPFGAALKLAIDGKVAGNSSPESRAKRLSGHYRERHPTRSH
jgi:hypothetical protein